MLNLWKALPVYYAGAILVIELVVHARQRRLRTATKEPITKDTPAKYDETKGRATYNVVHSIICLSRVSFIFSLNGIPWLWNTVGKLQEACFSELSPRADEALHNFFAQISMKKENPLENFYRGWTLKRMAHDFTHGRPVYVVLFMMMIGTVAVKTFSARVTRHLLVASLVFQALFIILHIRNSRPRMFDHILLDDEVMVTAITELATIAKVPLEGIYTTDGPLLEIEEGIKVSPWPKKNRIIIHKKLIEELSKKDIMALAAHAIGKRHTSICFFIMSQFLANNMVTMLMIYAGAKELYEAFNLEPKNDSYPVAAALVVFAIGSARPFHFYFDVIATCSVRKFSWVADKFAADQGYSCDLSEVLARIAIAKNEDAQVDRFYSILYNEKPLLCERLEWLEKGRQEEDAKDGVIRLPVDGKNEKL